MKKMMSLVLALLLMMGICSSASAACSHNNAGSKPRYTGWKHYQTTSDAYATLHYRDVYLREYCKTCGITIREYFDYMDEAPHSLPCSLCGAK